jgi:phosphoglycolate phosphatase
VSGRVTVDAVVFDLDGVLVDSRGAFARAVNLALEANGLPARPERELHRFLGPGTHMTFVELVGQRPDAQALIEACVASYRERYAERFIAETPVVDGIPGAVARLAATLPLVVATSKPAAFADPLLDALGLREFFVAVEGPDLAAVEEAKTETLRRALLALPGRSAVVMVGDRSFDVVAARAHGLRTIGVRWGIGSEEELRAAGAETIVATPDELVALLLGDA